MDLPRSGKGGVSFHSSIRHSEAQAAVLIGSGLCQKAR
jgi:hypothetical protein